MKKYKKYWADMHSNIHHGQMKDLERWYVQAKEMLDFWPIAYYPFGMKKLDSGLAVEDLVDEKDYQEDWEKLRAFAEEVNAEGWPMFMGYEWQGNGMDGDHNVFCLHNNEKMVHPRTYRELVNAYRGKDVIGIPHHVAYQLHERGKNWDTHDEEFSPFAEIYSSHGCSENDHGPLSMSQHKHMGPRTGKTCYEEGLNRGYAVGCIASGDNHHAPAVYGNGIMCALAENDSKEALFDALRKRRVYGTSGGRIALDYTIDEHPMGSILSCRKEPAKLSFSVRGNDAIDRVEILKDNILMAMPVHAGTWETDPVDDEVTCKMRLAFGWGPDTRIYPDLDTYVWDVNFHTEGKILSAEKCWHNFGQKMLEETDQDSHFILTTYQNSPSGKWMGQCEPVPEEMVFEIRAPKDSMIVLTVNGHVFRFTVAEALSSSDILPLAEEAKELIVEHYGPSEFYRSDAWWHNTYKIKRFQAVPLQAYTMTYESEVLLNEPCQIRLRVHQANGETVWSSPIFIR